MNMCVWRMGLVDIVFFFKQKTAYEMRISDWSSDVCSSDLLPDNQRVAGVHVVEAGFQAGAIVARTGSLVGVEVPLIDTSGRERIALQIDRLCCKNREA